MRSEGRERVIIENVRPEIDGGIFPAKRVIGEKIFPEAARMGFDVICLPPIHPIGTTKRKGKNNSTTAKPDDVGSPWAIGSEEGGHKSINPLLGTFEDFERFVKKAREHGIDTALDIAFQCSPDHPYVKEHPEWFRSRLYSC